MPEGHLGTPFELALPVQRSDSEDMAADSQLSCSSNFDSLVT